MQSLPPLNWLRTFEVAARHLSFTDAAGELNMTQSAVSQQIKALEGHLGHRLFERRARALTLTALGRNYLPVVQEAFQTLRTGTGAVLGVSNPNRLRVEVNVSFSQEWLAPRLARFHAAHPGVELDIISTLWEPSSTPEGVDVEIRFSLSQSPPGFVQLSQGAFYPVARPGLIEDATAPVTVPVYECLGMLTTWDAWAQGVSPPGPRPQIIRCQVLTLGLRAAEAGAGLVMAHDAVAADALAAGRLIRPFAATAPMQEAYFLRVSPDTPRRPLAEAFATWVRQEMALMPAVIPAPGQGN